MILGILGDTHFTNRSPERRIDSYWDTFGRKTEEVLSIFKENECDAVIQVGDFFDTPTVANRVKSFLITVLNKYRRKICCIVGQHDIVGHSVSTLPNSPLAVLEAAGVVGLLNNNPQHLGSTKEGIPIDIYGANFGEEVPEVKEKENFNILVIHAMIGTRPLYPGQDLADPQRFLRKYPKYNLVCAGDYHYRFIETYKDRMIINPGALIRKTISKFDLEHRPAVVIFDTDTNTSKVIELDVESIEKVFNLTRIEKKNSDALLQFIEGLKNRGKEVVGWKHILHTVLKERNSNQEVKQIIDEVLEEINHE